MKTNKIALALLVMLCAGFARANNLVITNVNLFEHTDTTAIIEFDISWDNSWRYEKDPDSLHFHDAVWVFFKVKPEGAVDWQHLALEGSGLNPPDFDPGPGELVEMFVPSDRVGMFVRRSQAGSGSGNVVAPKLRAVWNYADSGMAEADAFVVQATGIEMCYVAEGAFKVGDGMKDQGQFCLGGTAGAATPTPFEITGPGAIEIGNSAGKLWGTATSGTKTIGAAGTLPAEFPNGFSAFYCMKYELSQGQYTDFLNSLTRDQQTLRCSADEVGRYMSADPGGSPIVTNRNTIRLSADFGAPLPRIYSNSSPDCACNWLSWADAFAYADWAGLRPFTELEYEKACRGPEAPLKSEHAWGTTTITAQTGHDGEDGSGEETPIPVGANCAWNDKLGGPVRVGIYARNYTTRVQAGASYWGIMELSGSLWEYAVPVGNAACRLFTGLHGNGVLGDNGEADVQFWPALYATGVGLRGGSYIYAATYERVSDRYSACDISVGRTRVRGGRFVRSFP